MWKSLSVRFRTTGLQAPITLVSGDINGESRHNRGARGVGGFSIIVPYDEKTGSSAPNVLG